MTSAPPFVESLDLDAYTAGDSDAILDQVQAAVRSYLKWHLSPQITETVTLDGEGSDYLWLQSLHVTGVVSVTNEGTVLASDDYDWSENGYLKLTGWDCWSSRPRQIEVTFIHGYDEPPADVIGVVVAVASRAIASPTGIIASQSAGPMSVSYIASNGVAGGIAMLQHELAILEHYRIPARA